MGDFNEKFKSLRQLYQARDNLKSYNRIQDPRMEPSTVAEHMAHLTRKYELEDAVAMEDYELWGGLRPKQPVPAAIRAMLTVTSNPSIYKVKDNPQVFEKETQAPVYSLKELSDMLPDLLVGNQDTKKQKK
jgi:hypothetical protein